MAAFKLCLLLLALVAVGLTFTLANPTPSGDTEVDEITAPETKPMADLESLIHDAEDPTDDETNTIEGVSMQGKTEAEISAMLEVQKSIVEKDLDDAVNEEDQETNGTRKKRQVDGYAFRFPTPYASGGLSYVQGNLYYNYYVHGDLSDALAFFLAYYRDGAFRAVYRVTYYGRLIGYQGAVGRSSSCIVIVRQGLFGAAPSLSFACPRYGRWVVLKYIFN